MLAMTVLLTAMTSYPGFGDRGVVAPRSIDRQPRIEMARDLGPIVELTVRCRIGVTVLSYSKVERVYCAAKGTCDKDLAATIDRSCRGH